MVRDIIFLAETVMWPGGKQRTIEPMGDTCIVYSICLPYTCDFTRVHRLHRSPAVATGNYTAVVLLVANVTTGREPREAPDGASLGRQCFTVYGTVQWLVRPIVTTAHPCLLQLLWPR